MKRLKKWMNLSETEAGLFVWSALLIFLIRCAGLLFNNFSETAFLKRFGVEFLPVIYIINPLITLLVLGKLTNLMDRVSGYRILGWCLVFCGVSASAFRALIPLAFKKGNYDLLNREKILLVHPLGYRYKNDQVQQCRISFQSSFLLALNMHINSPVIRLAFTYLRNLINHLSRIRGGLSSPGAAPVPCKCHMERRNRIQDP